MGVDLRGLHLPAVYVVFVKEWLDLCLEIRRVWLWLCSQVDDETKRSIDRDELLDNPTASELREGAS